MSLTPPHDACVRQLVLSGFDGMSLTAALLRASLSDVVSATFSMTLSTIKVALEKTEPDDAAEVRRSLREGCYRLLLELDQGITKH